MRDEYELFFRYKGRWISGKYRLHDGMITVYSEYGERTTQIGGSAGAEETLARIMLRELADAAQLPPAIPQ